VAKYENFSQFVNGKDTRNPDEFDELMREYRQTGSKDLRSSLITAHLGLVTTVARKLRGRGLDEDDLIQEGRIGLMDCIDNHYDPNKGGRNFKAYAVHYIRSEIFRAIQDHSRTIRLPVNQIEKSIRIKNDSEDYEKRYGRKPKMEELVGITSISLDGIEELLQYSEPISLDFTYEGGDENREARAVDTNSNKQIELISERDSLKRLLDRATGLTREERDLINEKYGLNGYVGFMTNEELGRAHGITGERIRQKMIKIRRKIRNANSRLIREESAKS